MPTSLATSSRVIPSRRCKVAMVRVDSRSRPNRRPSRFRAESRVSGSATSAMRARISSPDCSGRRLVAYLVQADVRGHPVKETRGGLVLQAVLVSEKLHKSVLHGIHSLLLFLQQFSASTQHHGAVTPIVVFNIHSQWVSPFSVHPIQHRPDGKLSPRRAQTASAARIRGHRIPNPREVVRIALVPLYFHCDYLRHLI